MRDEHLAVGGPLPKDTDPSSVAGPLERRLQEVPDPRKARGRRHKLVVILVLTACATLVVGKDSVSALWQWAARTPQDVLARMGARYNPWSGHYIVPSERVFRRVLTKIDGDALDTPLGGWAGDVICGRAPVPPIPVTPGPVEREQRRAAVRKVTHSAPAEVSPAVAIDGKVLRGSGTGTGRTFLVGAVTHEDSSQLRTGSAPRAIASFRTITITITDRKGKRRGRG